MSSEQLEADRAWNSLSHYLDDSGYPCEAENIRLGVDLESYELEFKLIAWMHKWQAARSQPADVLPVIVEKLKISEANEIIEKAIGKGVVMEGANMLWRVVSAELENGFAPIGSVPSALCNLESVFGNSKRKCHVSIDELSKAVMIQAVEHQCAVCDGPNTYDPQSGVCAKCQDVDLNPAAPSARSGAAISPCLGCDSIKCEDCFRHAVDDAGYVKKPVVPRVVSDQDMRDEWRASGGHIHGPNVETVTMPEADYFRFRAALESIAPAQQEPMAYCEPDNPFNETAFAWPGSERDEIRHTTALYASPQSAQPSVPVEALKKAYELGWDRCHDRWMASSVDGKCLHTDWESDKETIIAAHDGKGK